MCYTVAVQAVHATRAKEGQMSHLKRVGILGHPQRPATIPVGERIEASFHQHEIATWRYQEWQPDDVRALLPETDIVIAIGGDGAMLRAARLSSEYDVPVLGVNMGRLGFLTEIADPDQWERYLPRLLKHDYWIERRMMVTAAITRNGQVIASEQALNDVVISGMTAGTLIQIDLYIDRHWATTYNSDALIIATPTGSTAYALAVGGPILPPDLLNILIIPTAPHLSMDRPIILSEGSQVAVRLSLENRHEIMVTVDGHRLSSLERDDTLLLTASDDVSRFVRMRERNYFYRSLLDRLEPRVNRSLPTLKTLNTLTGDDDR